MYVLKHMFKLFGKKIITFLRNFFPYLDLGMCSFRPTFMMSRLKRFCHLEFGTSERVISSSEICSTDLNSDIMNSSSTYLYDV